MIMSMTYFGSRVAFCATSMKILKYFVLLSAFLLAEYMELILPKKLYTNVGD